MMNHEVAEVPGSKFILHPENIFPQECLPIPELLSERVASLGWPLELQGTGKTDYGNRELKIHYPVGDVFFSFATVIHEIGHWRQSEVDENLHRRKEFLSEESIKDIVENETSAYRRGLERVKRYAPEFFRYLEEKFQSYKKEGNFDSFENFEQLYEWFKHFGLAISLVLEQGEKNDEAIYKVLQEAGMEKKFQEFASLRVGEKVNKDEMERFLMEVSDGVGKE